MNGIKGPEILAEIDAMIRVSGLSAHALSLKAGLSADTVKKASGRLREGHGIFPTTLDALRAAMVAMGRNSWLDHGLNEIILEAAVTATLQVGELSGPGSARPGAAMIKRIYDRLMTRGDLTIERAIESAETLAADIKANATRK